MKLLLITFALAICPIIFAQQDSIFSGGVYRHYLVHTPPSYVPGVPMPLVLAFHGFLGWDIQLETQSELSIKSDASGFIVVYPVGLGNAFNRSWNAGACCSYAASNNVDDVGFISNLIDSLSVDFTLEADSIYATGHSNGGMMCYRLACELSDKIAAIAPIAGAYQMISPCNPARTMPVIHFHSYLDLDVPVLGGLGITPPNLYFPPADSILNVFSTSGNCTIISDTVYDGLDYDHFQWGGCDCDYTNELYITHDGGHSWPGGNATFLGDSASTVINANDLMWDFFQAHSIACPTSSILEYDETQSITIYPNPTTGAVTLTNIDEASVIYVLDAMGNILFNTKKSTLDLSRFPSGVYFVTIYSQESVSRLKLVKE